MSIETRITDIIRMEDLIANVSARLAEEKAALMAELIESGETTVETPDAKVTLVRPTKRTVELGRLKEVLSRPAFDKVTQRSIHWSRFDAMADLGKLPKEARALVEVTDATPYVRITR
jgi:hypothetical protein